jgi:multidrug efflux pump subunit AcrA (membrane-fusion protein)
VDERTLLELQTAAALWQSSSTSALQFPVLMRLANEEDYKHVGHVNFLDNQVSATTGTIRMRGIFDNHTGYFKPGLFARIRLPISKVYQPVLVPDEAIMSDQGRKYVFVVKKGKNKEGKDVDLVEYRKVKIVQALDQWRVIQAPDKGQEGKEGIALGERVIVSGMQRVREGAEVTATLQPPTALPQSPLVKLLNSKRLVAAPQKQLDGE